MSHKYLKNRDNKRSKRKGLNKTVKKMKMKVGGLGEEEEKFSLSGLLNILFADDDTDMATILEEKRKKMEPEIQRLKAIQEQELQEQKLQKQKLQEQKLQEQELLKLLRARTQSVKFNLTPYESYTYTNQD